MPLQTIFTITDVMKINREKIKVHKHSWLLITWTFNKSNSMQTLIEGTPYIKLSHQSLREQNL